MLYVIHKGAVAGYAGGQSEVVHLVSSVEAVEAAGYDWVFTDGHADMPPLTSFYDNFNDLVKVDWKIMRSKYWHDTVDHPDRERRRQAEFLVHGSCPWELVSKIGVHNQETAENVLEILKDVVHKPELEIETGWYY
jgi:ssDNA thymidine ADP-ribosyltransferase, DarT